MKLKITWKFFVYLAVLILSAAPAVFTNSAMGYVPVLLVLFTGVLSFLWLWLLRKKLEFDAGTQLQSCTRGEAAQFRVHMKNAGHLPAIGVNAVFFVSNTDGTDNQVKNLWLTLSPGEERDFGFAVDFPHIGIYRAGIRRVELLDILGIFKAVEAREKSYGLEILPKVVSVHSLPVAARVQAESTRMSVQSPLSGSDYTGVREYAFGDPIKTIHWKLSAHAGDLMTKQTESYSNTGMSVVLDFQIPRSDGACRLDEFDAIVEAGVAAGNYAAENGMDYELLFYRKDGEKLRAVPASFRDLHGVVEEMALTEPKAETDLVRLLRENCQSVHSQANVVVCSTVADKELTDTLISLKQGGRTPILFLILSPDLPERERSRRMAPLRELQYANIACQVLGSAAELEV